MRLLLAAILMAPVLSAVESTIDWQSFLAAQDPVWKRMPTSYYQGPFVGNGLVGTIAYQEPDSPTTLRFEIGRTDVWDHRPQGPAFHYRCRLPIGQVLLSLASPVTAVDLRTDLWNAEVRGTITTAEGRLGLRCWAPSGGSALVWDLAPEGGESHATISFRPQQAASPRWLAQPTRDKNFTYAHNPPFTLRSEGDAHVAVQPLAAGSDYATAWAEDAVPDGRRFTLVVANRYGEGRTPAMGSDTDALAALKTERSRNAAEREAAHRAWWHGYWPASLVSVPDAHVQAFHGVQLYKMASATRPDRPVVDLMGPWYKTTVWPCYWHNLNTQLSYSSVLVTNHADFHQPLTRLLVDRQADLVGNVPKEWQADSAALGRISGFNELKSPAPGPATLTGDQSYQFIALPWFCQMLWQHARWTADDALLKRDVLPLLERAMGPYLHTITKRADGRWKLPRAYSDEYGPADGTNMDQALLRWGLRTLLDEGARLGLDQPQRSRWQDILDHLEDYYVDPATGYMIGGGQPLAKSHRHSSHLFQVYPFQTVHPEQNPAVQPLIEQSLRHFTGLVGDECMFKFTAASSLWATIGNGDESLRWLHRALEPQAKGPTVGANTLYSENGWPTFESPLSASRALCDQLLQCRSGVIHVLPAVPTPWKEVAFQDLRAEGAILVSAVRRAGATAWVSLRAEAPGTIRVRTDLVPPLRRLDGGPLTVDARGVVTVALAKDQEVVLAGAGAVGEVMVRPVPLPTGDDHRWGLPR